MSLLAYLLALAVCVGVLSIIVGIVRVIVSATVVGAVRLACLGERLRRDERLP